MLLIIFMFVSGSAFAAEFPTDEGSIMITGQFAFSNMGGDLYENYDDRATTIQFAPSVSYFISPGFAIGGKWLLAIESQGDYTDTMVGIGPQIVYFIGGGQPKSTVKGSTYPYLGAGPYIAVGKMDLGSYEIDFIGYGIGFGFGICHMLTKTVGLMAEAACQIDKVKFDGGGDSVSGNKFNIVAGLSAFLY